MCLVSNRRFPRIALKNIIVYKILCENDTPPFYRGYKYKKGINYPEGKSSIERVGGTTFVDKGYLHAFSDKRIAEAHKDTLEQEDSSLKLRIVEMKVPFGTRYYSGAFDICAKKLVW